MKKLKNVNCINKTKVSKKVSHLFGFLFLVNLISAQQIIFENKLAEENPLQNIDLGSGVAPIPVDIDNDDDYDLFIGTNVGTILYYKNISTEESPDTYEELTGGNNPLGGIALGTKVSPYFVDIDDDGDFDVFIGGTNSIFYLENEGTNSVPLFVEKTGALNPLSDVTHMGARSYSSVFVDIDNDQDLDVFIGWVDSDVTDSQGILYMKNIGTKESATFEEQEGDDNPFQSFNELYPRPIFVDSDGDGDLDVYIGKGDGVVDYYENVSEFPNLNTDKNVLIGFSVYPNPANGIVHFSGIESDTEIHVYNLYGKKLIEKIVTPSNTSIDVSGLNTGIYMVVTKIGKTKISKRLVIRN